MKKLKLTPKEKALLVQLLDHDYALQALDYDYNNDDQKAFKEKTGYTFKKAESVYNKLIAILQQHDNI